MMLATSPINHQHDVNLKGRSFTCMKVFVLLVSLIGLASCGGSKRGSIERYDLASPYGSLQGAIDLLSRSGSLRLICSPANPCQYDPYGTEYHVRVPFGNEALSDSATFVFTEQSSADDPSAASLSLLTGRIPGIEVLKQKGSMTIAEQRDVSQAFERSVLPLLPVK